MIKLSITEEIEQLKSDIAAAGVRKDSLTGLMLIESGRTLDRALHRKDCPVIARCMRNTRLLLDQVQTELE